MHTLFLGSEEVDAYLREFAGRLRGLGNEVPTVWCPIGDSGEALAERLAQLIQPTGGRIRILAASFDRDKKSVIFEDGDPVDGFEGQRVLVLDSAVHGGGSMHSVVERVSSYKPQGICTYGLVVKKGTRFVPSLWGVLIEDHDRAYFLLDELPNQHLSKQNPYFHLRRLQEQDLKLQPVRSGLAPIDRITWNDRFYDMATSEGTLNTYLLEVGSSVVGYLTVELRAEKRLTVQEVAVDSSQRGKKFGHALLRWAETLARQSLCTAIDLWAIENQLGFYQGNDYKLIQERKIALSDGETYLLMTKPILHHL